MLNLEKTTMDANQNVVGQAEKDYDEASKFFYSVYVPHEYFLLTGSDLPELVWSAIDATADAMEAGMDRSEVRLRAAAFVLRRLAEHGPFDGNSVLARNEWLTSARAARPGVVVPLPSKPEGE
jgi:hypothetical protein